MASASPAHTTNKAQLRRSAGGGLLSPAFIDELRNRTMLSTLIGRSVKLQKAGREFKGCCPFHNEKTPSFYVNDEKAFYHCFGCGAHGDAIRFLTEAKGLPFIDAVKELASAAGMELPAPDPAARARAEKAIGLVGVSEAAAKFYRKQLDGVEGAAARAYLDKRGIGSHARETFGIGFAPDGRNRLAAALEEIKEADLIDAGLLIKSDSDGRGSGKAYDRFRGRLMIPIRDPRGRTIAFGGRILDQGEPKYLNSPDTPLFDKGRTLFNLDRAGPVSRRSGRAIVVEGYMDVIALDQAGIGEAVAPLGTALTEAQMARLWTLVDAPILCFDGDAAGRKASLRAAHRALPVLRPGKTLRFALLPPGKDPDDLVREGGSEAFEAVIANAVALDELLYREARDVGDMDRPEARAGLRQTLNDLAAGCSDRLVAEEYRRSFNNLFFEEFGFKRSERRTIASAALRMAANDNQTDVHHGCVWAALKGLSQRPNMIALVFEDLNSIRVDVDDLERWRSALCSASLRHQDLDTSVLEAILETAFLPEVLEFNLHKHLRFSFLRSGSDERAAAEQLLQLIRALAEDGQVEAKEHVLGAEMIAATVADDRKAYESVAAEYEEIIKHKQIMIERARELGEMAELAVAA